jgi:hypothetical protein
MDLSGLLAWARVVPVMFKMKRKSSSPRFACADGSQHWRSVYGYQLIQFNRDKLQTQERFSQIGIAQPVISLYQAMPVSRWMASWPARWAERKNSSWKVTMAWTRSWKSSWAARKIYAINIVNNTGSGIEAGVYNVVTDQALPGKGISVCQPESTSYVSEPQTIGGKTKPVIIMSSPIRSVGKGVGAVTVILKLDDILHWVSENSTAGKTVYVVDFNGQIVVHPKPKIMPAGMDLSRVEIVDAFVDEWRQSKGARLQETRPFKLEEGDIEKQMLGTFFAVTEAPWGVIVQIDQRDAFATVAEMKAETIRLGFLMLLMPRGRTSPCSGDYKSPSATRREREADRTRRFLQEDPNPKPHRDR